MLMNKDEFPCKKKIVSERHDSFYFTQCYSVTMCLQVLKMTAFILDTQYGPL